LVIRQTFKYI